MHLSFGESTLTADMALFMITRISGRTDMPVQGDRRLNPITNFVVNGAAAAIARGAVNPWSVMKIRTQVGVPGSKMGLYPNFYWIRKIDGFRGFLKGAEVACGQAFVYTGIQFGVQQALTSQFAERGNLYDQPSINYLAVVGISGGIAGSLATAVVHPLDVLKVRQSVAVKGSPFYGHLLAGVPTLLKEGVFKGLYRGIIPSVMGSAVYSAYLFTLLEVMDNLPWRRRNAQPFVYLEWLLCPMVAMTGAFFAAHPFDLVRRKMMAQSSIVPKNGYVDVQFRGYLQLVAQILKVNGIFGFYHGWLPNAIKAAPQLAVFWLAATVMRKGASSASDAVAAAPVANVA